MRSVGATFYYLVYSESRGLRPATMDWRYPLVSGVWPRWCVPALLPRQLPGNLRVQWVFHHFWFHSQRFFPSHDVFRWSFGPPDVDHSCCFVAVLLLQENIRLLLLRHYGTNFRWVLIVIHGFFLLIFGRYLNSDSHLETGFSRGGRFKFVLTTSYVLLFVSESSQWTN